MIKQVFILIVFVLLPPVLALGAELSGQVTINGYPAGDYGIVLATPDGGVPKNPKPMTATIVQEKFAFHPPFLIVTVGSTIRFENRDHEIHNAKSYSRPNAFDIGAHFPNTIKETILKNPGMVTLRCKVHHTMRGTILVVPTESFAKTGSTGEFHLKDLQPGPYRLTTWFSGMDKKEVKKSTLKVQVKEGKNLAITLKANSRHAIGPPTVSWKEQDWWGLLREIHADLKRGLGSLKTLGPDQASALVMKTYYQKFGQTGLRSLISQELGENRGRQLEDRFLRIAEGIRTAQNPSREALRDIELQIADLTQKLSIEFSRFDLTPGGSQGVKPR